VRARALLIGAVLGLAAADAAAQQRPTSNRDQPITINADSLEVQQDKQVATFTGNVDATQGDMRLKAQQVRVFYRQAGREAPRPDSGKAPAGNITRIEATGRVFISSPTQTAEGDTGVYDVEQNTITLVNRVVLTQGQNILRGARAVMDLSSGQARMDGRVSGFIVPNQEKKP